MIWVTLSLCALAVALCVVWLRLGKKAGHPAGPGETPQ
jgi:hypothetical protein